MNPFEFDVLARIGRRSESGLLAYDRPCEEFDWQLRVFYGVTCYGRHARGPIANAAGEILEIDEGEAPEVDIVRVVLRRQIGDAWREMNLPLDMIPPDAWSEIEQEIVEEVTREMDAI